MALDEKTLINRLYQQKKLDAPILSLAMSKQSLTFGSFNNDNCATSWHDYPVTVDGQWIFDVKLVDVLNGGKYESVKVSFLGIKRKNS